MNRSLSLLVILALLAWTAPARAEMAAMGGGGVIYYGPATVPPVVPNALPVLYVSTPPANPATAPSNFSFFPSTLNAAGPQAYGYYSQGYYYAPVLGAGR